MSPFDQPITIGKKTKRAIPVKLVLTDESGYVVTDMDITAPPVINVTFGGTVYGEAPTDDSDLLPVGGEFPIMRQWVSGSVHFGTIFRIGY